MRVFFACPMSAPLDAHDPVALDDYLAQIRTLLGAIRSSAPGRSVFCAFEAEGWGAEVPAPGVLTRRDFDEMRCCDLMIALFTSAVATSVLIELGWAMERQLPVIICEPDGERLPMLVYGLEAVVSVRRIKYHQSPVEVIGALLKAVNEFSPKEPS